MYTTTVYTDKITTDSCTYNLHVSLIESLYIDC